jgi:hypothetical protein
LQDSDIQDEIQRVMTLGLCTPDCDWDPNNGNNFFMVGRVGPNANLFADSAIKAASHEFFEAVSDP